MDAPTAILRNNAAVSWAPWRFLLACALLTAGVWTLVLALLLLVRGWLGFLAPLAPSELLATGVLLASLAFAWHWAWHRARPSQRLGASVGRPWVDAMPGLAFGILALALSVRATPLGVLLLWLPLLGAELAWWLAPLARSRTRAEDPPLRDLELPRDFESPAEPSVLEADDERVVQRTVRLEQEGVEQFVGQYRCRFQPQERTQVVHVVFCPPFAAVPELSVAQLDGPPAQLKIVQAQTYGVRLEVRLANLLSEPADVVVELVANPLVAASSVAAR